MRNVRIYVRIIELPTDAVSCIVFEIDLIVFRMFFVCTPSGVLYIDVKWFSFYKTVCFRI